MTLKRVIKNTLLLGIALCVASCDAVYDNRDNCVNGIQLKFRFDYHMERGANAFASNVDCVDVYVFDNQGNYLTRFSESTSMLQNENYRMILPLPEGDYRLMVYGGLSCENPAFEIFKPWEEARSWDGFIGASLASRGDSHSENIVVSLPHDNYVSKKQLHDKEARTGGLFYGFQYRRTDALDNAWADCAKNPSGIMEVSVTNDDFGTSYTEYEVNMMKDTNDISVILQELSAPYIVDYNDFEFAIVDDNFHIDAYNVPIHVADENTTPTYLPHSTENRVIGYADGEGREGTLIEHDQSKPVQVGYVQFATSRLHLSNYENARLVVKSHKEHDDDGSPSVIIDVPLIQYLSYTRGFGSNWIKSDQEYLDRQSNWSLYFFLQTGRWIRAKVAVNDWIVRVNDIELGGM